MSKRKKYKDYIGYKKTKNDQIERIQKFKDFIPAEYIIFEYLNGDVIFGSIVEIESVKVGDYGQGIEHYLVVNVMGYVSERTGYRDTRHFGLSVVKKLYSSSSFSQAKEKWKEIHDEAEMKITAKKYNL